MSGRWISKRVPEITDCRTLIQTAFHTISQIYRPALMITVYYAVQAFILTPVPDQLISAFLCEDCF